MNITYQVVKTKMPFNLFHRKKPEEEPEAVSTPEQTPEPESTPETLVEVAETTPVEESTESEAQPAAEVQPKAPAEATTEPEPELTPQPEEQTQESPTEPAEAPIEPAAPQEPQPEPEPEQPPPPPVEEPKEEKPAPAPVEQTTKIYLKAMPLKDLVDVESVKEAVSNGNIIILRITPLAGKSIEDVKKAVNDLFEFAESINGDIARLGEERVVICPKTVRIWREKTPAPVANRDPLPPTTA